MTLLALTIALFGPPAAGPCAQVAEVAARALADNPVVGRAVFAPAPLAPASPPAVHALHYAGRTLRIPADDWRCGAAFEEGRFQQRLLGPGKGELLMLTEMPGSQPMADVFAFAGDPATPSAQAAARTRDLFGKAPDLFDIEEIAWSTDAGALKCDPAAPSAALRDALTLVLKTTASRIVAEPLAVRLPDAHLIAGRVGEGRWTLAYSWREGDQEHQLLLETPRRTVFDALVAALVHPTGPAKPLSPRCAAVDDLVNTPTPEKAKALKALLGTAPGDALLGRALDAWLAR